jgi:hypothetical protein
VELKLGGVVFPVTMWLLIGDMFLEHHAEFPYIQALTFNKPHLPCFAAAISFTVLGFMYFLNISYRCQFWKSRLTSAVRLLMSFWYAAPILVGYFWFHNQWPFFAAAGMMLVLANNALIYRYARQHRQYLGDIFTGVREKFAYTMKGYMINAGVGVICLLFMGVTLLALRGKLGSNDSFLENFDLALAMLVVAVNGSLLPNAVAGDSARVVWSGLALEYSIREQASEQGIVSSKPLPDLQKASAQATS